MMKNIKAFLCRKLGHNDRIRAYIHDENGFRAVELWCKRCNRRERQSDLGKERPPSGWLR